MSFYRNLVLLVVIFFITSCTSTRTLKEKDGLSIKQMSERGIIQLKNGHYEQARLYFSSAIKLDPKDCQLHFLNGLSYQLQGKSGNFRILDLAAAGYRNAIRFCPNDSWPYYYLGLIELQEKNYQKSQMLFMQALKHGNGQDSIIFLKGFIKSAQKARDYTTINLIIQQLKKIDPKSPLIKELIKIRRSIPPPDKSFKGRSQVSRSSKAYLSKASPVKHDRKQVFIDVVFIISIETQSRERGVNLLNGLQLQYGNSVAVNKFTTSNFFKYANSASRAGFDLTSVSLPSLDYSTLVTHAISIPDVTYNLNIFNDVNEHDEILSRPTLLARDGKVSTYFAGNRLIVGVSGLNTGQIESIPIGLTMKVTPTFKEDNMLDMDIEFGREQLISSTSDISASNINSVATTAKQNTNTSVKVHFGETIILSALTEGLSTREENRTPGLGDIPLIRYLFGRKVKGIRNTSVLVLLTPRKEVSFEGEDDNEKYIKSTKHYYKRFIEPKTNLNVLLSSLTKGSVYNAFTTFHADFYSQEILNRAVDYSSSNIDDY